MSKLPSPSKFVHGDHNVVCDVCGFVIKASKSKKRWDGLIVCPKDWEPRYPGDTPVPARATRTIRDARPVATETYRDTANDNTEDTL